MSANVAYFVVAGQSLADGWFRYPSVLEAFRSEFLRLNPHYSDVQFFDAALGGTTMLRASSEYLAEIYGEPERATRYWYDEASRSDGPIFDIFEPRLADWAVGKDVLGIIWDQGQSDTPYVRDGARAAQFTQGLDYVLTRLMALSGAPNVYFQGFGDRSDYQEGLNAGSDVIRQIQQDFSNSRDWAHALTTTFDLPLADTVHLTEAGYVMAATRMALAISTGIASPLLDFATMASDGAIYISLDLAASQGLNAPATADAFRLLHAGHQVAIGNVAADSAAGLIVLTPAAPVAGALLQYASATFSFQLAGRDLLYSGELPVQPFNVEMTRSRISVTADGSGHYRLTGSDYSETIVGFRLADILVGGAGHDLLDGGAGADRMEGGTGDDIYIVDNMRDIVRELVGQGTDLVNASVSTVLGANVERLTLTGSGAIDGKGNGLANILTGNASANRLYGVAGDDRLSGLAGNDRLDGGMGADRMQGGVGNDIYFVDNARDITVEYAAEGTDVVYASVHHVLRANLERLYLRGTDDLVGKGNDLGNIVVGNSGANRLYGLDGSDRLYGLDGNDLLDGGNGNDRIEGDAGNDKIYGGDGADVLIGENGADWLQGGAGRDRMYGGEGADRFVFDDGEFGGATTATADQIHDFDAAEGDRISLSLADANALISGDQAFAWIDTAAFSGTAGELRTLQGSGNTFIQGDINGDGIADFLIRIDGLHTLTQGDFIL